nr:DUF4421 family protein [uncultured Flavobacterium sp.]
MVVRTFCLILIGGILDCFAQEKASPNPYFKTYDDKVIASLYYLDVSNNFQIVNTNSDGIKTTLDLIPNRREQLGMSLSYKFADISYGFSPQFFDVNKDNGNSKLFNISTRFIVKKWMQTLSFINQKGFYVSDGGTTIQLPKLRSTKIGGVTSYIFNPNFSYKAIANQKEWQTKSSGSFIPNFSFFYTNLDLNSADSNAQSDIFEMTVSPSYYYNFVINNRILLSAGLSIGGGISNIDGDISGILESSASLKIGYNTNSFFSFLNVNYIAFVQEDNALVQLNDNVSTLNVTVGYRFDPPNKVKEAFETVHQKTGL